MAKRVKESAPESGLVKVVDPLYDAPVQVESMPEPPPPPAGPGVRERVRRFFEVLLRLISWVIIFTVFGAALYYGLPMLYQKFVVPVEQNTAQMAQLQSQQKQLEEQLAGMQEKLTTLESEQNQNVQSLTDLGARTDELETSVVSHTQSLAALEKMQSQLEAQDEETSAELQRQIDLMKSMELLSRARLYMYQSNFGLARQDVKVARDLLIEIEPGIKNSLAEDVDAVVRRLDLVLTNLPSFPVVASDDLDIAWQILVTGLPEATASMSETPTLVPTVSTTPEATLTPTPQLTATP